MNTHRATPVSTQEAHPWRSVVRTFVAAAVGVVLAWLVRVLGVDLTPLSQPIIDSLTTATWVVGTGLVQWLLTRPWAQPVLEAIGLGTGVHTEQRALAENVQRSHGDA